MDSGPKTTVLAPLSDTAERLPYPLGRSLRELLQARDRLAQGMAEPQFPYKICAVTSVFIRLAALLSLRAYVAAGKSNPKLNHDIIRALRAPADGAWLDIANRASKALKGDEAPGAALVRHALSSKPAAKLAGVSTVFQALERLVKFRNGLLKGASLDHDDFEHAMSCVRVVARGFSDLAAYRLEVFHAGQTWLLTGSVPRPVSSRSSLREDEPCLVHRRGAHPALSLSPLLRFRSVGTATDENIEVDELFFLDAADEERLSYIGFRTEGKLDGRTLGTYEAFKEFIAKIPTPPIPRDPRVDFSGLADFHSRLFVGRSEVLAEIAAIVRNPPAQYAVLKALPGMGKSAIFATLFDMARRRAGEEQATELSHESIVRSDDRWVFHFCRSTDGCNSPTVALRSLIAQICDHLDGVDAKHYLSHDLDELKDQKFPALLMKASKELAQDERLVVAIDALDEGSGVEKESVANCIPAGEYPGVVFLLSYRVDASGRNTRVEEQLRHIAPERLRTLGTADPLVGLNRRDVERFLERVDAQRAGTAVIPEATREAVWRASTAASSTQPPTADPFYLRLVADGVQSRTIRLRRAETIPEGLEDAFEQMWMTLPTDMDFLCHRVLITLAVMRDYGSDELFADLFNRDRAPDERLTPSDVASVRTKAGKLLLYDGDRYGLFHDRFRHFLVGEQPDPLAVPAEHS